MNLKDPKEQGPVNTLTTEKLWKLKHDRSVCLGCSFVMLWYAALEKEYIVTADVSVREDEVFRESRPYTLQNSSKESKGAVTAMRGRIYGLGPLLCVAGSVVSIHCHAGQDLWSQKLPRFF